jgi:hypothetical protein
MTPLALATERGLWRSDGAPDPLDGADVTTLVPGEDGELWALVGHRKLQRIVGGRAERIARLEGQIGWCLLARFGTVWAGTDDAGLFRLEEDRMERVRSFDEAPTHEDWHQPGGRTGTTWTLDADAERLYVNVHVGGILRSADRGRSFSPTIDLLADVHHVSVGPDARLWAATGLHGLAESRDAGDTWTCHRDGLHSPYLTCAAPTDDGVLVVASSGYASDDSAVYRFDGARFAPCPDLPPRFPRDIDARRLAARGTRAALAGGDGRLYASEDAGRTWKVAAQNLPDTRAIVLL